MILRLRPLPRIASSLHATPRLLGSQNGPLSLLRPSQLIGPFLHSPSLLGQRLASTTRRRWLPSPDTMRRKTVPTHRHNYDADLEQVQAVLRLVFTQALHGRLPIIPEQADLFIDTVQEAIGGRANPNPTVMNMILKLCNDEVTVEQATLVAFAIIKEFRENGLAWFILACTSQMGDIPAMIFTVATGLGKRSSKDVRVKANAIEFALPKLLELEKKVGPDTTDKDLLLVLGMMKEKSRDWAKALHYYERALEAEPEDEFVRHRVAKEALRAVLRQDWDGVAGVKARLGDRDGARELLEMGAWDKDAPMAWFQLARMQEQDSSLMRDYLRQAAKGGVQGNKPPHPEATKLLGIWYVRQSQIFRAQASSMPRSGILQRILGDPVAENLRMGIEWLRVAAFYGHPDNHIFLGLALREIGQRDEGFRSIETVKAAGTFDFEDYKNNWYLDIPIKDKTSLLGLSPLEIQNMLGQ